MYILLFYLLQGLHLPNIWFTCMLIMDLTIYANMWRWYDIMIIFQIDQES